MKKVFLFTLLLFLSAELSVLLGQDYIYKQYTTADGLPSSEVYHVFQDSKGYIWFATDNGVSRYNGYEFENFDINDGLATNSTSEIYEDKKGRIWFIGITSQLSYYLNDSIYEFKYNGLINNNLPNDKIFLKKAFYVADNDDIFISIKGAGLFKITLKGDIYKYSSYEKDTITQIIHKLTNNINIPSTINNPRYIFNKVTLKQSIGSKTITLSENQKKYPHHLYISQISATSFWYFTGNHSYLIEAGKIKYHKEFQKDIVWAEEMKNEGVWICTVEQGARLFENKEYLLEQKHHFLDGKTISSILKDNNGSFWFTTINNGVYYLESSKLEIWGPGNGLYETKIECIELLDKSIWIGYNNNSIAKIFKNKIKHQKLDDVYSFGVKDLYYNQNKKQIIAATSGYIYLINENKIKTLKNNHSGIVEPSLRTFTAVSISSDNNNGFWIGGGHGFFHLNDEGDIDFDSRFDKNFFTGVNSIYQDKYGVVWLGCRDGLRVYKNKILKHLGEEFPALKSRILDMIEYGNTLILATKGHGIIYFDKNTTRIITKNDGLPANTITTLTLSDTTLWVGSPNGVCKIELPDHLFTEHEENISIIEELSNFEINEIETSDSSLFIATNRGLVKYKLDNSKKAYEVPLHLKEIKISGKTKTLKEKYTLSNDENSISVKFEALSFNLKQRIQYKYKLIGLDNDWIKTNERVARYYHLKPGTYEFNVMAKNTNGKWQNHPIKIQFNIFPAIWQTTPFKISIVLLSITLLLTFFWARQASNKQKSRLKKDVTNFMNQAITRQIHPHFLFNTLNSINNYILKNDKNAASSYLTKFSELIRNTLEYSQYELISLSEELGSLELYLNIEAMRLKNKFEYSIKVDEEIDLLATKVPTLILQPFVENSIWHGIQPLDKKGVIKIKISKKESNLAVEIIDNGVGRDKAADQSNNKPYKKKSLGAKIIRERLKLLEKKLKRKARVEYIDLYANNKSIGTKVKISLPHIQEKTLNQPD